MTKLDFRKSPESDPARVLEVRESGVWSGSDKHPFETEIQRKARHTKNRIRNEKVRADKFKKARAKAELKRNKAIISKFGFEGAARLGVPRDYIEARMAQELKPKKAPAKKDG